MEERNMKKANIQFKIIFLCICVMLITCFIFSNSLKDSVDSLKSSNSVAELIGTDTTNADYPLINSIVRKLAHVVEFCALGITVMWLLISFQDVYQRALFGYGFFYVLFVAVIDEYIQSFSDRTSSVSDVLLDFAGALIGFVVVWCGMYVLKKIKKIKFI